MTLQFQSGFGCEGFVSPERFSESAIKSEPMLFGADFDFACAEGRELTSAFMQALPPRFVNDPTLIIDSRVHMLMPGWFPCIPGWHLDDVPRTRPDGQPDHANPAYRAEHAMMIIGDASRTEFTLGKLELEDVPVGAGIVYGEWHTKIEGLIHMGALGAVQVPPGQLITFGDHGFHRGCPATKSGWRFFIRASHSTQRKPSNEIRRQVQVYLPAINGGW